ncbi:hypothetical protein GCM10007269_27430 [Microbacterium murale]|uniref:Uncharacterized protein n=1 Tax=Microbacterium murale TaxID=1081040 RepID=A0ABQ1RXD6_9MICO|nr:hypothetical protein GCM10007269_27430 [Microbacterium murale]
MSVIGTRKRRILRSIRSVPRQVRSGGRVVGEDDVAIDLERREDERHDEPGTVLACRAVHEDGPVGGRDCADDASEIALMTAEHRLVDLLQGECAGIECARSTIDRHGQPCRTRPTEPVAPADAPVEGRTKIYDPPDSELPQLPASLASEPVQRIGAVQHPRCQHAGRHLAEVVRAREIEAVDGLIHAVMLSAAPRL